MSKHSYQVVKDWSEHRYVDTSNASSINRFTCWWCTWKASLSLSFSLSHPLTCSSPSTSSEYYFLVAAETLRMKSLGQDAMSLCLVFVLFSKRIGEATFIYSPIVDYDDTLQLRGARIASGYMATSPYQVALMAKVTTRYIFVCGGSIINDWWILTAAHCIDKFYKHKMRVVAGTNDLRETKNKSVVVRRIFRHRDYIPFSEAYPWPPQHDIALLKLWSSLSDAMNCCFHSIHLPQKDSTLPVGSSAIVSGFGSTQTSMQSRQLLAAQVTVLSDYQCFQQWGHTYIAPHMMCAAGVMGKDICTGDSGGPLVVSDHNGNDTLWGITSFLSGRCGENLRPSVFTRVVSYIDWLEHVIRDHQQY